MTSDVRTALSVFYLGMVKLVRRTYKRAAILLGSKGDLLLHTARHVFALSM